MTSDRRKQAEGLIYEYAFDLSATGRAIHTVASELLAAERELEQLRDQLRSVDIAVVEYAEATGRLIHEPSYRRDEKRLTL